MLFNSFQFLIFLPIVFILYWFAFNKKLGHQNILLLIASYFFYGWWSWKFLGLLAFSTLLDYNYGFQVASPVKKRAKLFLWLSVINNLAVLGIFKYYNFFATQIQQGLEMLGLHSHPILLHVVLPVGISFYTFHGMSYVFDIYRGKLKPVTNFPQYALFVSFFPLLVAGPIERANHLLPQVQKKRVFNYVQAVEGCKLMLWGMFKKVVVADGLAGSVDYVFGNYHTQSGYTIIIAAIAFSFQIYSDFSGYTDIALGTAKLFGFELLSNFRFPYFSRDIAEFWRRWHISLSSWFRDYLYIPLGGSRVGKLKSVRNIFIIFLVSGFWHGANWTYISWGFIHACGFLPLLLLNRNRENTSEIVAYNRKRPTIRQCWQMIKTFVFVTAAWIFFRADSIRVAFDQFKIIVTSAIHYPRQFLHLPPLGRAIFTYVIPLLFCDWRFRRDERRLHFSNSKFANWIFYIVLMVLVFNQFLGYLVIQPSSFIYFQF
jgi:alginate O-acetyltransferase complex protein AlgI